MELSDPVSTLMTRSVLKAHPEDSLLETARRLREFQISGMPVVDDSDHLIGLISEVDLVRDVNRSTGIGQPRGLLDLLLESQGKGGETPLESAQRRLSKARVSDAMVRRVVTLDPDDSISEAARQMQQNAIHRLPVVDAKAHVLGIVSRVDLLRAITGLHPEPRRKRVPTVKAGRGSTPEPRSDVDPYGDI